jgi:cobalt-zinc-cadmium efflux system outer membrane protein
VTARAELLAARLEADAVAADARLVARERFPVPSIAAGYKGERVRSGATAPSLSLSGFLVGFSMPLPLFDRRAGAIAAADASARQASAEGDALQRRIAREIADAAGALRSADAERTLLLPYVGDEARLALRAVQAAFAEGEITLAEWLDAVRAWQETELALLTLDTDIALRRVALARALGLPIFSASDPVR